MSDLKGHTPGPWYIQESSYVYQVCASGSKYGIARIYELTHENIANAYLIAAAPELLEALENLERTAGIACMENDPARVAARAAIAKAKGDANAPDSE